MFFSWVSIHLELAVNGLAADIADKLLDVVLQILSLVLAAFVFYKEVLNLLQSSIPVTILSLQSMSFHYTIFLENKKSLP